MGAKNDIHVTVEGRTIYITREFNARQTMARLEAYLEGMAA